MDISELAKRCREESLSRDADVGNSNPCFELFRMAIVERRQQAWELLYELYKGMMLHWADQGAVDAEDVVHCAFEKFLNAVGPDTFGRFTGIAGILAYLRRCVRSVYIDHRRRAERERLAYAAASTLLATQADGPERKALERIANTKCAEYVYAHLNGEQERLVVRLNLELSVEPAEIVRRYPSVFATVEDVYRIRSRVVRRLAQDPMLRRMVFDLGN